MDEQSPIPSICCCAALADYAVIPMGGIGLDELVFASFNETIKHGDGKWWLYVSTCFACRQNWMVAQDERIYDNFYLRRLAPSTAKEIEEVDHWPEEFLTYERVLALGKATGTSWRFLEARSPALVETAVDLLRERPEITVEEIASLLAIPTQQAADLLD